jgi:hypothetical protein
MSDEREYEDLESLLKAPGWLRFANAVKKEWEGGKFDNFIGAAVLGQKDAMTELVKLAAGREAVLAVLQYPEQRLRQLDAAARHRELETQVPLSRRGVL